MFRPELWTGHRREICWAAGEGAAEEGRKEGSPGRRAARKVCDMLERAVLSVIGHP